MIMSGYTLKYTFPKVRVRFQDRYFYLVRMFCDAEHVYLHLEFEYFNLSTANPVLRVRMNDFRAELESDSNFTFHDAGTPAGEPLVQLLTLVLDASVAPSKIEGFLLKNGIRVRVRRNWFGSVEFEQLSSRELSQRDHEMIDTLLLEWENSHDEQLLTQTMNLLVNHSGFELTLDDFLREH